MLMPPPPHATQVCSQEYLDRLLAEGHERGYCVLEAVGMCFLAEDMDGWTQEYRTFCIELVRALLAYNILGDQLYLPYGSAEGEPLGVRASHFGGFAAPNILAFLANASARRYFREHHREECASALAPHAARPPASTEPGSPAQMSAALPPYPPASPRYKCLVERMFNQRDIENYFSELISILGYKPTKQGAEARTRQVDFNLIYRHDEDLGTRARTVREKKYSREALVFARGNRCARHAHRTLTRHARCRPSFPTRVLARVCSLVWPCRWNSGRAFYRVTGVWHDYTEALQGRAARDGRAPRRGANSGWRLCELRPREERPPGV